MTHDDLPRFSGIITVLAELFDKQLSQVVIRLYFDALKDLPVEAVERAAGRCSKASKFMPKPAEIREHAGVGSAEDRAMEAWRLSVHGSAYASVDVYDRAMAMAIEQMGGWVAFRYDDRAEYLVERDFMRWYKHFEAMNLPAQVTHMCGIHEGEGGKFGTLQLGAPTQNQIGAGDAARRTDLPLPEMSGPRHLAD